MGWIQYAQYQHVYLYVFADATVLVIDLFKNTIGF